MAISMHMQIPVLSVCNTTVTLTAVLLKDGLLFSFSICFTCLWLEFWSAARTPATWNTHLDVVSAVSVENLNTSRQSLTWSEKYLVTWWSLIGLPKSSLVRFSSHFSRPRTGLWVQFWKFAEPWTGLMVQVHPGPVWVQNGFRTGPN